MSTQRPKRTTRLPARLRDDGDHGGESEVKMTKSKKKAPTPAHAAAVAPRAPRPSPATAAAFRRDTGSGTPRTPSQPGPLQAQPEPQRPQTQSRPKRQQKTKPTARPSKVGKAKAFTEAELKAVMENQAEREKHLQDLVNDLSEEQAKMLLKKIGKEQPGIVLEIMDVLSPVSASSPQAPEPGHTTQPHWCTCGNCRLMATALEEVCCRQRPESCLSTTPEMQALCLEPHVLRLNMLYRADLLALRNINQPDERSKNRSYRYAGYRQHILWQHGRLGYGVRRVIASCCIWKIRDTYPEPSGQCVGFRPGRF